MNNGFIVLPKETYDEMTQIIRELESVVSIEKNFDHKSVAVNVNSELIYSIAKAKLEADPKLSKDFTPVDANEFSVFGTVIARRKDEDSEVVLDSELIDQGE